MNRVLTKISVLMLTILVTSSITNAIDNEFKNSLTKVELTKTNENSYNINLYTSKKYSEPVKIIKKSDLNYYILLPETNNSALQTSFNTSDIRNVDTKVYQYAGADVNNGYTKINISTTKPLNFKIAVKNNVQAASKLSSEIASNSTKAPNNIETTKNQKKNLDFQKIKIKENSYNQTSQSKTIKNETKITSTKSKVVSIPKNETSKKAEPTKKTVNQVKKTNTNIQTEKPKEENIIKPVEIKEEIKEIKEETTKNETLLEPENTDLEEEFNENNLITDKPLENIEQPKKDLYDYLIATKRKLVSIKHKLITYKTSFTIKLNEYGLSIRDIILMSLAGIISFIVMLLILTRKTPQPKLKNRADLIDKNEIPTLTPKKPADEIKQTQNNGQYFIFDKNIKQTGFCDPATSAIKKNYELSSYDPDLRDNYKRAEIEPYGNIKCSKTETQQSEYDIIQKILKEDSFIEIAPQEMELIHPKEKKQNATSPITKEEVKPQLQKQTPQPMKEPEVLSNVEIAPERGFMCISYNDNISLMGYIFDDVFALHNFKAPRLENYNIKFRLSEKTDKTATFIVKVDKTKMLIKVTKSTMTKEVVM